MVKGSLACILRDTAVYTRPVGVTDQVGAVRHHAGFARQDEHCLILSDPWDWEATPDIGVSNPWSQILLGGQVVWVKNHCIAPLVHVA
jgi:hypothetical protein